MIIQKDSPPLPPPKPSKLLLSEGIKNNKLKVVPTREKMMHIFAPMDEAKPIDNNSNVHSKNDSVVRPIMNPAVKSLRSSSLISRSMDSLVVPTIIAIEDQEMINKCKKDRHHAVVDRAARRSPPPQETTPLLYSHQRHHNPFKRQVSLRDRSNKRSFFASPSRSPAAMRQTNGNFARRVASSWRKKKSAENANSEQKTTGEI